MKKKLTDEEKKALAVQINEEKNPQVGAIINTEDNSGKEFFDDTENIHPVKYLINAYNGGNYDFKAKNRPKKLTPYNKDSYNLGGMPINGTIMDNGLSNWRIIKWEGFDMPINGTIMGNGLYENIYASRRDIGNYRAADKAYDTPLPIGLIRTIFDLINGVSRGNNEKEKPNSTIPQNNAFKDNKKRQQEKQQKETEREYILETGQTLPLSE